MRRKKFLATLLAASMLLGVAPNLSIHAGLSQVGDTSQSNTTVKLEKTADPSSVIVSIPAEVTLTKKTLTMNDDTLKAHLQNGMEESGSFEWYYPCGFARAYCDNNFRVQSINSGNNEVIVDAVDTISYSGTLSENDALVIETTNNTAGMLKNGSTQVAFVFNDFVKISDNVVNFNGGADGLTTQCGTYFYATSDSTVTNVPVVFSVLKSDISSLEKGITYTGTVTFNVSIINKEALDNLHNDTF